MTDKALPAWIGAVEQHVVPDHRAGAELADEVRKARDVFAHEFPVGASAAFGARRWRRHGEQAPRLPPCARHIPVGHPSRRRTRMPAVPAGHEKTAVRSAESHGNMTIRPSLFQLCFTRRPKAVSLCLCDLCVKKNVSPHRAEIPFRTVVARLFRTVVARKRDPPRPRSSGIK